MTGDVILKYRIGALISSGALGDTYKGTRIDNPDKVFIRSVNFQANSNIELKLRIKNDLYTLSQIDHPNIARIFEYAESGSNLYIISEYVEGRTLYNFR